ncbi:MAG: DNA polymerase I, partial [Eggerthellaceae bacterium]|nr:DNA polymerase I [Eggerthellaceae bacterium]
IPVVKVAGWEGDDILGTVAARGEAAGDNVLLVTGDKDACQLVTEKTHVVSTKKGISDVVIYDPEGVREKYGVGPEQIPDYLGLMGDASDNIPGVPGIGPKNASKLLQQYGTMEGIYEHVDELRGKQQENIRDNKEAAFLSRTIATIVRDLDFELDLDAASFPSYTSEEVNDVFGKLGMRSHLAKVLGLIGGQAPAEISLELAWEGYATGAEAVEKARTLIGSATEEAPVGLACSVADQASLFEAAATLAVAGADGAALVVGDDAIGLLAEAIRTVPFACVDAKALIEQVYPPDTSREALLSDDELSAVRFFDCALASYVLQSSTEDYGVGALAQAYLGGSLPEGESDEDELVIGASAAAALVAPLRRALAADGTLSIYDNIDAPLLPVLAGMERVGAALDTKALSKLGQSTGDDLDQLVSQIHGLAGEEFNIDSPKQVGHILFEVLGLPPLKKTQRGYSTDAKVLTELSEQHELPGLILHYRELAKIKGTYIDALPTLLAGDARLHTSFNITVTTTGRLSSSDPNLQNIPVRTDFGRQIRACFVPLVPGHVFLSADYSQIELRLLAHLSGDEHLVAAFCEGEDFHAETAARVFGVPVAEVTSQQRSRAKAVNFGIVYGQQAFGLSQSLRIPFGEAQEMIDRYFDAYPGVRAYLKDVVAQAHETGFATTMFGRKRHIPELRRGGPQRAFGERTAMNHPMQGSAADIIKMAMVQVAQRLRSEYPEALLMLQVHDELDLSVPEGQVEGVSKMLKDVMENVVELSVPLVVDVSSGANWAEAH